MPPTATVSEPLTNGLYTDSRDAKANGVPRGNGAARANGVPKNDAYLNKSVFPDTFKSATLNDQYAYTPRKLRVITIGAGFSGLLMAHKFQHRFPEMQSYVDHTIFEGHKELGGTWLV